ncbi:hypothetical protein MLD38_023823 [Melastoma candidum]|uniref:Uncharacterized protein n=1 Tax=Melastoma candidum TaxID=119954 RepID=A0ACB9NX21_9MYRT|nr:hypothetical protein MLD38_023823 [Melastoma candidum]
MRKSGESFLLLRSRFLGFSSELKRSRGLSFCGNLRSFKVVVSVAAAEKPSKVHEIILRPIQEISGTVKLPGSKSLSNRILLLASLSEGTTLVDNLLNSDDVHYMLGALRTLGLNVEEDKALKQAVVEGCGGSFPVGKESKDEVQLLEEMRATSLMEYRG